MSLTAGPRLMLLAAVMAITATFLALPAGRLGNRALQHQALLPAVIVPAAPFFTPSTAARVCVTRRGLCPVGLVRAGDPCSCPDPLHGSVSGHVEPVGGPLAYPHSRNWPSEEEEEESGRALFGP
jgi:hypothetical protein